MRVREDSQLHEQVVLPQRFFIDKFADIKNSIVMPGVDVGPNLDLTNDITERQKTKETLENARLEAERASSAKTLFLATMSHEIRTLLNAMIGVNDLLSSTPLDSEQTDLVKIARQSGTSLLEIVSNILDFSKIESGKIELELQETDLCAVIESVLSIMGPKALEKNLELFAVVDYPILEKPLDDPLRVKQVLLNLAANAIKFTERGSIESD